MRVTSRGARASVLGDVVHDLLGRLYVRVDERVVLQLRARAHVFRGEGTLHAMHSQDSFSQADGVATCRLAGIRVYIRNKNPRSIVPTTGMPATRYT